MTQIYKLDNKIKYYEWGSPRMLPQFLGIENEKGDPFAEMWMGTHISAPSQIMLDGNSVNLDDISGELPFLFKLLGVEKPLSIQAHPNKTQAEEGFLNEEAAGLALNAPTRSYVDSNHKPEMICALSSFTLMAGFRETREIRVSLEEFVSALPQLKEVIFPLLCALEADLLAAFFRILFNFSDLEREYITDLILKNENFETGNSISPEQWKLMKYFASQYPKDPAILAPVFLNMFTLQPFQAVNLPSGILHAYINGFGVELMASSNNVVRGGLTHKYIDIPELMNIVDFVPFSAQILSPLSSSAYRYPSISDDFSLSVVHGGGDEQKFNEKGPAICIVAEGELAVCGMKFKKGESFFIPADTDPPVFCGNYTLFAAIV